MPTEKKVADGGGGGYGPYRRTGREGGILFLPRVIINAIINQALGITDTHKFAYRDFLVLDERVFVLVGQQKGDASQ